MEIGVGSAISKTYGFISVARYSPKGGEGGPQAFIKNVFPKGIDFDQRAMSNYFKHNLFINIMRYRSGLELTR